MNQTPDETPTPIASNTRDIGDMELIDDLKRELSAVTAQRDELKEQVEWFLEYAYTKTLGSGVHDFDFAPVTNAPVAILARATLARIEGMNETKA